MSVTAFKTFVFSLLVLILPCALLVSCDKKSNQPDTGSIDVAVGTFKGKITVFDRPAPTSSAEYFDAIVTVTKTGDNQLTVTAKPGEAYSDATPKTFTAANYYAGIVNDNGLTGSFTYRESNKELGVVTDKGSASARSFIFNGTKQ